jgi:cytidyltransferase-like protein
MYKRIYTIGCFDYFHHGHKVLLERMKAKGKIIIVGIHDDKSIEELKNLTPEEHEPLKVRIQNVKKYADIVYVIPDKDPTLYVKCMIRYDDNKENACFMRGDDMPNFPSKDYVDTKINIEYLTYTDSISSTQIRNSMKKK